MKILSLFSGLGAFEKALFNLGIKFDIVGFSEIDKYAVKAYCLIHKAKEELNLGDIRKINEKELPEFDLMTYGFPCQDISVAGRQRGIIAGQTRSGLLYDALRIAKEKKPKYMIAENVKNLLSKNFKVDFDRLIKELEEMGYNNYYRVLNAKDYGIPQNRERVFIVSIRNDIDKGSFEFPIPIELKSKVKDFLEDIVDEKYYWSEKAVNFLLRREEQGYSSFVENSYARCFRASASYLEANLIRVKDGTKKGYKEVNLEDDVAINLAFPNSATRRGRVMKGYTPTLDTNCSVGVFDDCRLRKLTPKECFRLMGFDDSDCDILKENMISDTQLYKLAGNSIVVNVLEEIFKKLL